MKPPLLCYSELSGEIYIVTRYKIRDGNSILAERNFNVTGEFDAIINKRIAYKHSARAAARAKASAKFRKTK